MLLVLDDGAESGWESHPEGELLRERFRRRVTELAEGLALPLADPLPELRARGDEPPAFFPDGAWRAAGHEHAARLVRRRLAEEGVLPVATRAESRRASG